MSTTFFIDRRISLCTFAFADGRRCRMPHSAAHPELCVYHARKDAEARAAKQFGMNVAGDLAGKYTSACGLTSALSHLFAAVAQGHVKSKTANTLAYLGQTMVQSIHLAQKEFITTFGERHWQESIADNLYPNRPKPQPKSDPK